MVDLQMFMDDERRPIDPKEPKDELYKTGAPVRPEDKTVVKDAEEMDKELTPYRVREKVPYMVVVDGPRQGVRFEIREGENLIGRSPAATVLLEDQSVSRRHSSIKRTAEGFVVEDLGSKNGTFVNGRRIKEPINIGHGDVVQVGIYALRLIVRRVSPEDEFKPLPPEAEGRTMLFAEPPPGSPDTAAIKEDALKKEIGKAKVAAPGKEEEGKIEIPEGREEGERALAERGEVGLELKEEPEVKRPKWLTYAVMGISLVAVICIGLGLYWYSKRRGPAKPPAPVPPPAETAVPGTQVPPPAPVPERPKTIPVFLDFASNPLPAEVMFEGKSYGITPVKVSAELEVGKTYSAVGIFKLEDISEVYRETITFTVERDKPLIPLLFKAPIGTLTVESLPPEVQLYVEGYFIYDPFKGRPAKLAHVAFQKPIYVPYGKYKIELRRPKQLGDSTQFVEDICYIREIVLSEDKPNFTIKVTDEDLKVFPVEIRSIPEGADVFVDGKKAGQTPFKGDFPLGEHTLVLVKDGYYEYQEVIKHDINILVQKEIRLRTSEAGEYINAGRKFLLNGLYADAIAQLSEAFKHSPTEREMAETYYLLGNAFLRSNDFTTAKGYFEQALGNEEFKYPSMLGLVSIYASQQNREKALQYLVDVMLNASSDEVKREAHALFQQVSPLRSVMYIYSEPTGAQVIVNGNMLTQTTPMILPDLTLGNYKVKIVKDGYEPVELNLNFSVNEFNPVIVKLKKIGE